MLVAIARGGSKPPMKTGGGESSPPPMATQPTRTPTIRADTSSRIVVNIGLSCASARILGSYLSNIYPYPECRVGGLYVLYLRAGLAGQPLHMSVQGCAGLRLVPSWWGVALPSLKGKRQKGKGA